MNTTVDQAVIEEFLDIAEMHWQKNAYAEGYWIGRAVQHANQNAVDDDWLFAQLSSRGLDTAVIAVPKGTEADPRDN